MRAVLALLALAALVVPLASDGGYAPAWQWAFAAAAGTAGIVALAVGRGHAVRLLAAAPIAVLLAIAGLEALSAAWTTTVPVQALRSAAVVAGYATVAFAAAVAAQPVERVAAVVAVAAGLTALSGLVGVAAFSGALAERIEGGWRPEASFGYPPALALIQVCALPVLLTAMARARLVVAALAAAGAALAAGVLVLAVNRLSLGLAVLVVGVALVEPERTVGSRRRVVAAAVALMAAAGLAFHASLGGWTPRHAEAGAGRMLALVGTLLAVPAFWLLLRAELGATVLFRRRQETSARHSIAAGAVVLALAVGAGLLATSALSARRFGSHQGFAHGRTWIWSAAYHAALERPVQGSGAGSFLIATLERQPGHGRLTRFAHDLPLELGVEVGIVGFLLALALYGAAARTAWLARDSPALWLLGPAVAVFLVSNLVDWPWHLAGVGGVFAIALGSLAAASRRPAEARYFRP